MSDEWTLNKIKEIEQRVTRLESLTFKLRTEQELASDEVPAVEEGVPVE
jgi:hypothetical protein